jgi:hypothetical protein
LASQYYKTAQWFTKFGDHKKPVKWMNLTLRFLRLSPDPKAKQQMDQLLIELAELKDATKEREEKQQKLERTIRKAKKEIADGRAKLGGAKDFNLCWEVRRLLQLCAQVFSDWQHPSRPWLLNYQQALKDYGEELSHPETVSPKTLYWLGFMAYYRGQPEEEKQWESELEFWLLDRTIAPKATGELILCTRNEYLCKREDLKARREFLAEIDRVLAERDEELALGGCVAGCTSATSS